MGTTSYSNVQIYDPQYQTGFMERVAQMINVWNANSRGTLILQNENLPGDYEKTAFWKALASSVIQSRDPTDTTTDVTATAAEQGERVDVKVNRMALIEWTLDSLRKIGMSNEAFSFMLGERFAERQVQDMLDVAISAVQAGLSGETNVVYDKTAVSGTTTLETKDLIAGLSKFGDQGERIQAWVMHSQGYYDLMKEQAEGDVTNIADRTIYEAVIGSVRRPVIVTDSPSLKTAVSGGSDIYYTLGLVEGAVLTKQTENETPVMQPKLGKENLIMQMQTEYAYNVGVQGFAWDTSSGGTDPTDSELATAANWDKVVTSDKDLAGVMIKHN